VSAAQLLVLHDRRPVDDLHRDAIGVDNILFESDYPHGDGTWPDTQHVIEKVLGGLPVADVRKITHENAAGLYRHPLPARCLP
jgi:predicted TIM-barrel fold metal-dependent hydrolase